ncbi:MAG TPA: DUF5335 family protein [Pyrinomonadaceae bacterium]|nr:DUF5335 family protein [Pyrinomonadaceae bacterium]
MSNTIEVTQWTNYFRDFSERNLKRSVRLEIFDELGAQTEVKKLPLAGISVELDGKDAPRLEIMLGGLSADESGHLTHTVTKVTKILSRADDNDIEDAVEFISENGVKTLLCLEDKEFQAERKPKFRVAEFPSWLF